MILFEPMIARYSGVVVAKLPFVPFSLVRNFLHFGLRGTDYTDCAMVRSRESLYPIEWYLYPL